MMETKQVIYELRTKNGMSQDELMNWGLPDPTGCDDAFIEIISEIERKILRLNEAERKMKIARNG